MKYIVLLFVAIIAAAQAFSPFGAKKAAPAKKTESTPFFQRVFDMDLFAPVADQNDYGARNKKAMKTGTLSARSYVPAGLSKDEYAKVRAADAKKKSDAYSKNVAKAGKFVDFTDWYVKRGTDVSEKWVKSVTRGHTMVKTKYDWQGVDGDKKLWAKND